MSAREADRSSEQGNDPVDQSPTQSGVCVDGISGQEHLERTFPPDCAHHGRGTEQSDTDTGWGERGVFGSDREVGCGNELKAGSSG